MSPELPNCGILCRVIVHGPGSRTLRQAQDSDEPSVNWQVQGSAILDMPRMAGTVVISTAVERSYRSRIERLRDSGSSPE